MWLWWWDGWAPVIYHCLYYRKAVMTLTGTDGLLSLFFFLSAPPECVEIGQAWDGTVSRSCWDPENHWHRRERENVFHKTWNEQTLSLMPGKGVRVWKEIYIFFFMNFKVTLQTFDFGLLSPWSCHYWLTISPQNSPSICWFSTTSSNSFQMHFKLSLRHWAIQNYFKMFKA